MSSVIILTGASGSGKSEIIRLLKMIGQEDKYSNCFHPILIPKYTTRSFRNYEINNINKNNMGLIDVKPVFGIDNIVIDSNGQPLSDNAQQHEKMRLFSELNCDLVYEQYGNRYGIYTSEIYQNLKKGKSPIIILNDIRAVEDLKILFGDKCISLFVFRKSPKVDDYLKITEERNSSFNDAIVRYNKANSIYRIYIENIHMFDKLVLNVQDGFDGLKKILYKLVDQLCSPSFTPFKKEMDSFD